MLRWYAEKRRKEGAVTEFVLFKSDIPEAQRLTLSSEVGITWADIDSKRMGFSQDFKSAWLWYIHHKVGEMLQGSAQQFVISDTSKFTRILGL